MAERFDRIWHNARLATMRADRPDLGVIEHGVIAARGGHIVYRRRGSGFSGAMRTRSSGSTARAAGSRRASIDCHTHLVYGGNRAHEFELRLAGASYEEIARAGGGIVSTVAATRAASEAELVASALPRLDALIAEGVTTIEIKSGYGLDARDRDASSCAPRARSARRGRSRSAPPSSARMRCRRRPAATRTRYIDLVCDEMLPAVAKAGLADAVDAFCEGIAFSAEQTARVFEAAQGAGLPVKLHADQLSNLGGAALAAQFSARCPPIISNIPTRPASRPWPRPARSRCCCRAPSISCARRRSRRSTRSAQHGVPMALATDCNPGTSPLTSLLLAMNMARDAVPHDGRRMPRRRDARGRARARACSMRSARSKPARAAISRSGTSSARPSSSIASASIRCIARVWRGQ